MLVQEAMASWVERRGLKPNAESSKRPVCSQQRDMRAARILLKHLMITDIRQMGRMLFREEGSFD